jgi:hypothetical protein
LQTRRLHALAREKPIDGLAVNAEDATHPHRVEASVVDQSPNRLGMHAELRRDLTDADEISGLSVYGRHNPPEALQVSERSASAGRIPATADQIYLRFLPRLARASLRRLVRQAQPATSAISARMASEARTRSL